MKRFLFVLSAAATVSLSQTALAKTCSFEITAGDDMKFSKNELVVEPACKKVKVTFKHTGNLNKQIMGHNWVLLEKDAKLETFAQEAIKAGADQGYLPANKKGYIAATKLLGGGESDTVTFSVEKVKRGQEYTYLCSFPGHATLMNGKMIFKK